MVKGYLASVSAACSPAHGRPAWLRECVPSLRSVRLVVPLFLMALSGCTVTLSPDASGMKAGITPAEQEARASQCYERVAVGRVVIEETGHDPYRNIVIEEHELRQALEDSLAAASLLAKPGPGEDLCILDANVIKTPLGEESGMLTITAYIEYVLTDRRDGNVLFRETIAGWERARFGRSPDFHEQAIRKNIERLLSRLTVATGPGRVQD